jgi:hypothetical protein
MALTDNRKKGVDWPAWKQSIPVEVANTAISCTCAPDVGAVSPVTDGDRYLYYYVSTGFFKFDTYNNTWVRLSLPNIVGAAGASMKYAPYSGHRGRVVAAVAGSVTFATVSAQMCHGKLMRIVGGTGKGQTRMLVGPSNIISNKYALGRATTGSATAIADTTQKWRVNEHVGRQVSAMYGGGMPDVRNVLYNDATTLTVSDPLHQQHQPFENQGWSSIAPHTVPVSIGTGVGTHYTVDDNTFATYDVTGAAPQNWDTTPDCSSKFVILTGGIWLFSSLATPFYSLQYYDVLTDTWITKTTPTGLILAAATEWNIERTGEVAGAIASGTFDAGSTTRVLIDAVAAWPDASAWTVNCLKNFVVRIIDGSGIGERRRIVGNTATTITVDKPFVATPDATSDYEIYGASDKLLIRFGGSAGLFEYDQECDMIAAHHICDSGIACRMAVWMTDCAPFYAASGTRSVTGVKTINPTPTAPGSAYVRGDILDITTGGTNAKVYVNRVSVTGGVEELILVRCGGGGYGVGVGRATSGGTGTLCTVEITAVATIGRIATTGINHHFRKDDMINFGGDAAWAGSYTVLAVDSLTTFDVECGAAGNASPTEAAQSATRIVDASKNWTVNEHAGKYVSTQGSGLTGTLAIRRIDSNTATCLTLAAGDALGAALTDATGRYAILDCYPLGRERLYPMDERDSIGYATGGSGTTLVDSTKNWIVGQWVGHKVKVLTGTGYTFGEVAITGNDKQTLTTAAYGFTPDATSQYIVDSAKLWPTNCFAGKRARIIGGAGFGNEVTVNSNNGTTLTFTAVTGLAPDATSEYVIYGPPAAAAGAQMIWPYGSSVSTIRSKYIFGLRGASNTGDSYDMTKDRWEISMLMGVLNDVFGAGSMVAYDGGDFVYFHVNNTGRIYRANLTTFQIEGCGQCPVVHSTVVAGNRMEIVETVDHAKVLYIMQNSGQILWAKVLMY